MFAKIKKNWITILAFIIASGIPCIAIFINYYIDNKRYKEQTKISYSTLALTNKPFIVISNPKELIVNFTYSKKDVIDSLAFSKDSVPLINTRLSIKLKLKLKNLGNASAKLIAIIPAQYPHRTDTLRYMLKDLFTKSENNLKNTDISKDPDIEIFPQDSLVENFDLPIENSINSTFIQHFLILYQNDAGSLFDTYYRISFLLKTVQMQSEIDTAGKYLVHKRIFSGSPLIFQDAILSTKVYSKIETSKIYNMINNYSK